MLENLIECYLERHYKVEDGIVENGIGQFYISLVKIHPVMSYITNAKDLSEFMCFYIKTKTIGIR